MDIWESCAFEGDQFHWMVKVNEKIENKEQVKLIINLNGI